MTNGERIELLRRVAEVAPKEMGAVIVNGIAGPGIMFGKISVDMDTSPFLYFGVSELGLPDINNAPAIIAMLDAMEKVEQLSPPWVQKQTDGRYRCGTGRILKEMVTSEFSEYVQTDFIRMEFDGETRAIAVARAFVACFGGG